MRKNWIIKNDDPEKVFELAKLLGVTELTAKILIHRGITQADDAKIFLNPQSSPFNDPFEMLGMSEAVERISRAINCGEKICVYGDYDVDGMSASAILLRALRKFRANCVSYIPDRSEGYGLNIPALKKISAEGSTLLITVDCGISNEKEISSVANEMDVIVTDHHLPALEKVTSAVAVLDPNQLECNYPEKNLCGAGVAFKLSQAISQKLGGKNFQNYSDDLDLTALATVADLVPLTGENRKIVQAGLSLMPETKCLGLRALIEVAGLTDKKISAGHIAFQIAPRLNSVGRLESASIGLQLLLTENPTEAADLATKLDETNKIRKEIETDMLSEAEKKVQTFREISEGNLSSLVIDGADWNSGVIGLTASKLVEKYNLPTIVLSAEEEISRGSCRSIPALHMKTALDSMADLFEKYGGHSQAAGFSIRTEKIPELRKKFDDYVRANLTDEDFLPRLYVDALMNPSRLTLAAADEFRKFEPYGLGNPKPVLACKNIRGMFARTIGREANHLCFTILADDSDAKDIRAVAWNCAKFFQLVESESIDLAYEPEINEWQDSVNVQCMVNYLEPSEEIFPDRTHLAEVYKFLKRLASTTNNFERCDFARKFNSATGKNFSMYTIFTAIEIFCELGFISIDEETETFYMPKFNKKLNLKNSRTFRLGRRGTS